MRLALLRAHGTTQLASLAAQRTTRRRPHERPVSASGPARGHTAPADREARSPGWRWRPAPQDRSVRGLHDSRATDAYRGARTGARHAHEPIHPAVRPWA